MVNDLNLMLLGTKGVIQSISRAYPSVTKYHLFLQYINRIFLQVDRQESTRII